MTDASAGEVRDRRTPSSGAAATWPRRRAQPNGWWGMALFLCAEATLFGTLIGTYFYLDFGSHRWPPRGHPAARGRRSGRSRPRSWSRHRADRGARRAAAARAGKRRSTVLPGSRSRFVVQAAYLAVQVLLFRHDLGQFTPAGERVRIDLLHAARPSTTPTSLLGLLLDLVGCSCSWPARPDQLLADRRARARPLLVRRRRARRRRRAHLSCRRRCDAPVLPNALRLVRRARRRRSPGRPSSSSASRSTFAHCDAPPGRLALPVHGWQIGAVGRRRSLVGLSSIAACRVALPAHSRDRRRRRRRARGATAARRRRPDPLPGHRRACIVNFSGAGDHRHDRHRRASARASAGSHERAAPRSDLAVGCVDRAAGHGARRRRGRRSRSPASCVPTAEPRHADASRSARELYAGNCSSCHGIAGAGISTPRPGAGDILGEGPPLRGVGALAADFYLRTGLHAARRTPTTSPDATGCCSPTRRSARSSRYVASLGPGPAHPRPEARPRQPRAGHAAVHRALRRLPPDAARAAATSPAPAVPPLQTLTADARSPRRCGSGRT